MVKVYDNQLKIDVLLIRLNIYDLQGTLPRAGICISTQFSVHGFMVFAAERVER